MAANTSISSVGSTITTTKPIGNEIPIGPTQLISNPNPKLLLNKKVIFSSREITNPTNPTIINEDYTIHSTVSLTQVSTDGKIFVLLFPNSSYGLKFYYPNWKGCAADDYNHFFMTYCKVNSGYVTGYSDYVDSLPLAYVTAFKNWGLSSEIVSREQGTTLPTIPASKHRKSIVFNFDGNVSKTTGVSGSFTITFNFTSNISSSINTAVNTAVNTTKYN